MRATAKAQPNIALIKYWGKRDTENNLPAVGSISVTLADLFTEMTVSLESDLSVDQLFVNELQNDLMLPRISACLDNVLGESRAPARIDSRCNFPVAAGLASSASSFAATVLAASAMSGEKTSTAALASLAGRASGSAARSLYGGFAELQNTETDVSVQTILENTARMGGCSSSALDRIVGYDDHCRPWGSQQDLKRDALSQKERRTTGARRE